MEEHLPVALGLMCLYDAELQQLTISALGEKHSALAGKLDLRPDAEMPLDQAGLAQCKTSRSIYFTNVAQAPGELPRQLALAGLGCAVATSLTVEEKLFGILVVARAAPDSFSSGECEFLNMLIKQVLEMTRPRWRDIPQGHGVMVELKQDLGADLPPIVGIESELREALTNLILNAVDAMPQGGKPTLRTCLQAPPENAPALPARVVLEVEDTGIGMDEETRRRCLEPFFSTKGTRGTGMGLAMVYGVMQRHDGKIEIRSEPGRGTTLRLSLPVREPTAAQPVVPAVPAIIGPLRILCIDDEPMVRDIMKEFLESDGHTVQIADSGATGLEDFRFAVRRNRLFDVVITDLGMPLMDGRQVAKTVKLEAPQTPVIMLTGWGSFMTADGEAPEYVDVLLSKPPRLNELREALAQVMRGA
jgi:CheY-like chemotaxis protein